MPSDSAVEIVTARLRLALYRIERDVRVGEITDEELADIVRELIDEIARIKRREARRSLMTCGT